MWVYGRYGTSICQAMSFFKISHRSFRCRCDQQSLYLEEVYFQKFITHQARLYSSRCDPSFSHISKDYIAIRMMPIVTPDLSYLLNDLEYQLRLFGWGDFPTTKQQVPLKRQILNRQISNLIKLIHITDVFINLTFTAIDRYWQQQTGSHYIKDCLQLSICRSLHPSQYWTKERINIICFPSSLSFIMAYGNHSIDYPLVRSRCLLIQRHASTPWLKAIKRAYYLSLDHKQQIQHLTYSMIEAVFERFTSHRLSAYNQIIHKLWNDSSFRLLTQIWQQLFAGISNTIVLIQLYAVMKNISILPITSFSLDDEYGKQSRRKLIF